MLLFFICLNIWCLSAQNTVGLIRLDETASYNGFNLIYPHNQSTVYLLNNCGQIVHQWEGNPDEFPGNATYLLEDGNLLRTKRSGETIGAPIWAGGAGEAVECKSWDNQELWSFELNDSTARLHHDIAPLPNGNVLMIAWEVKTEAEALAAGRNPALMSQDKLWPDFIIEYDPDTDAIVWEWHAWDHLIQDFDDSKDNFGVVEDHPELIDINWDTHDGHPDWMHVNAIDYNPVLDQIAISVPYFNEVWIVDHSTTTEEASGHSGGNAGRGGDLLYRWGNPATYRKGDETDQELFFQHDIQWIAPDAQPGELNFGKMALFNNRVGATLSTANTIATSWDTANNQYLLSDGTFEPSAFEATIVHPDNDIRAFSNSMSSVQVLPNGNTLICASRWGYSYEVNSDGMLVWEYITPIKMGLPVTQGDELSINDNIIFSIKRYDIAYPAFSDKTLDPIGYIELEPNENFCGLVAVKELDTSPTHFYPNPVKDWLSFSISEEQSLTIDLYDINGFLLNSYEELRADEQIDMRFLASGIYLIKNRLDNQVYFIVKAQ